MRAKICKHGKFPTRSCKECKNEWNRKNSQKQRKKFPHKNSEYLKNWRKENPEYYVERDRKRAEQGICLECDNKPEDGNKLCSTCRIKITVSRLGIDVNDIPKIVKQYAIKKCRICDSDKTTGKGWHFDHDHVTKKFRGILCHNCNLGLGQFKDKELLLLKAINYLRKATVNEL